MAIYAQQGSGIPGVQGVAAVAPPTSFDGLDAFDRLQKAFKSGFMGSSDILDNLMVKPSERRSKVAINRDNEELALANIEARPTNTRRRIAEDALSAEVAEGSVGLVPEMTAVQRGTLKLTMQQQANAHAEAVFAADMIPIQAEITQAGTKEKRAIAQARFDRVKETVGALLSRMKADETQAAALASDPEGLKAHYGKILEEGGLLLKPASQYTIPELASMTAAFRQRNFEQAREMLRIDKALPLSKVSESLRKEFDDLPEVKSFRLVQTAFGKLNAAASKPPELATAQDDMAAIFSYMKLLDPGSTVREGEYNTATKSGGWPTEWLLIYNNAVGFLKGAKDENDKPIEYRLLDPKVRKGFLESGKTAYVGQSRTFANALDRHVKLAKDAGVPLDTILGPNDFRFIGASIDDDKLGPDSGSEDKPAPNKPALSGPKPALYNFPDPENPGKTIRAMGIEKDGEVFMIHMGE